VRCKDVAFVMICSCWRGDNGAFIFDKQCKLLACVPSGFGASGVSRRLSLRDSTTGSNAPYDHLAY
jgi:hypothetical protein